MPRTYLCKKCGLPKKGHTCYFKFITPSPATTPAKTQRTAAGHARALCAQQQADSEDEVEEEEMPVLSGTKRKFVVLDDDEEEDGDENEKDDEGDADEEEEGGENEKETNGGEEEGVTDEEKEEEERTAKRKRAADRAEEARRLIAEASRLIDAAESDATDKEKSHRKEIAKYEMRIALMDDKIAALRKEKDEFEKLYKDQVTAAATATRAPPWDIHTSVTKKLTECLRSEMDRIEKQNQAIAARTANTAASSVSNLVWTVKLDNGDDHVLPQAAQDGIAEAVRKFEEGTLGAPPVTFPKVFSQNHNGHEYHYNVVVEGQAVASQVNTETGKKRQLTLKDVQRTTSAGNNTGIDLPTHMNGFQIPLKTASGGFLFAEEYEQLRIQCVHYDDQFYMRSGSRGGAPEFSELVGQFTKPFFPCSVAAEESMWLRPSQLFYFLSLAHETFVNHPTASVVVWAHGTGKETSIMNDLWGLNQRCYNNGGAKGEGVYVASNPYVPMEWANRSSNGKVVFGALVCRNTDHLVERYRMDSMVHIANEPPQWKTKNVPHAIVLRNSQLSAAIPFGSAKLKH